MRQHSQRDRIERRVKELSMRHATYEIHLRGALPPGLMAGLDGATCREVGSETVFLTLDIDQASLHHLVSRLGDLGIELIELRRAAVRSSRSAAEQP